MRRRILAAGSSPHSFSLFVLELLVDAGPIPNDSPRQTSDATVPAYQHVICIGLLLDDALQPVSVGSDALTITEINRFFGKVAPADIKKNTYRKRWPIHEYV